MADRPTGTVTFLFTDIEGSSRHWEQEPPAMQTALAHHDTLLHQTIATHGGYVFKTLGDGFRAAFARAPDALAAALAAQRALAATEWPTAAPVRVRMALHTGTVEEQAGDYFGPPLNRTARLLTAGHGGQILLSLVAQELVRGHLPAGTSLIDLGPHYLPDLIQSEHIFQLVVSDLPAAFPPLRTLDRHPHNLPAQLTPLIGREREIAAATTLARQPGVRLVTFTGPGGTGKTRLALQVAADLSGEFPDGVFFVNLAPIAIPTLVGATIATTLGLRETGATALHTMLKDYLRERQVLLVLDNFEQVLAAAPLVTELLQVAPGLTVLVTSRAALHVSGEHEFAVPPLALPERQPLPPLPTLSQYEAVRLFIARAQAVKADFQVTNANAPAVAEICYRLDGLPLAIELAATRIRILSPQAMLPRLERRLALLTSGARDVPTRQQTLRNAIDWSYDLLEAGEQALFRRLAVFVGGATLDAIAAVCNPDGDLGLEVLDAVATLVDQSLLRQQEQADGESRFLMLETIREYALERLAASGEADSLRQRHAAFYLALAERAEPELRGPQQVAWLDRLEQEHDNLRAVLQWADGSGAVDLGLRLASLLHRFWLRRGYYTEGRTWLAALLNKDPARTTRRTAALDAAADLAASQSDFLVARRLWEEMLMIARELDDPRVIAAALLGVYRITADPDDSTEQRVQRKALLDESLTLFRSSNDRWGMANVLRQMGRWSDRVGDQAAATRLFEESLTLFRERGDKERMAWVINNQANSANNQQDYVKAHQLYGQVLTIGRELGDKGLISLASLNLGILAFVQDDYGSAERLFNDTLVIVRELGNKSPVIASLIYLGEIARYEGNYAQATALFKEGLSLAQEQEWGFRVPIRYALIGLGYTTLLQRDYSGAATYFREGLSRAHEAAATGVLRLSLIGLAVIAAKHGQWDRALRLGGAAEVVLPSTKGEFVWSRGDADAEQFLADLRSRGPGTTAATLWEEGQHMLLEEAVALALAASTTAEPAHAPVQEPGPAPAPTTSPARRDPDALTAREVEVLQLVAAGLTDAEIATHLVLSPRTVQVHLRSIYSKLGLTTRSAATRYAIQHQLA